MSEQAQAQTVRTWADIVQRPVGAFVIVVVVLGVAWSLASRWLGFSSFPGPLEAVRELPAILLDPSALWAILQSLARMFAGYVWALLCAIPLGLAMARSRLVYDIFYPLVTLAYPMP